MNLSENRREVKEILDPLPLTILARPKCRGAVHQETEHQGVACEHCRLLFEIRDGVPLMPADAAEELPR